MTRDEAWKILTDHTKKDALIKHGLSVETCMRKYAEKFGEDVELWGIVGLLHDFDYEMYPSWDDHPFKGNKILEGLGCPEEIRSAIMAHAPHAGEPRDTLLKKTIFAVDELAGFITAVALVRPSKKVADVKVKSVRKKFKDKHFAAAVNREEIHMGIAELEVDESEHIQLCIDAMTEVADDLGL